MGLTKNSTGIKASDTNFNIKNTGAEKIIAIAGNPNVGKSTVFNSLTGMRQHTGNWPGKTVTNAQGLCKSKNKSYLMVDIPGTYSLFARSAEEEVARDYICFGNPDAVVVVCDATCLERNLNLVLQITEITSNVIVCINLMDEAERRGVDIKIPELSKRLGVPVIGTVARKKKSLAPLLEAIDEITSAKEIFPLRVRYCPEIEKAISIIEPVIRKKTEGKINSRWLSLKFLEHETGLIEKTEKILSISFSDDATIISSLESAYSFLDEQGISREKLEEEIAETFVRSAEDICDGVVVFDENTYNIRDRKADRILTSKWAGYPVMLLLLVLVFWLTLTGANYPSQLISGLLFRVQDFFTLCLRNIGAPEWVNGVFVLGAYRVLAWVVSVMLPPMAIFFPLFTLLEDLGYLPRVAYNLDKPFRRCNACGKQALTMCMGFGCNAAGIVGCRIIDSPRERLLAVLTNSFVPCNGRFPVLIAVLTMFFVGTAGGITSSLLSSMLLTIVILVGIGATFGITFLLSKTILKGVPSSFTLELPPYRMPQIGKVIVRSIFDRTLFVLGRAVAVAIPAGIIIWIMANVRAGDISLLNYCAQVLDPFANLMGIDGVILIAFILGFPANEIVIPIIIMAYTAQGTILELDSIAQMKDLFINNGWTWITAINVMLFCLMHWPCSTTLLTVKKETGSWKWTALAAVIPTIVGVCACMVFTFIAKLFIV